MVEPHSDERSGKKITVAHFMPWSGMGGVEIATLRLIDATREQQFRHVVFCLHDATALRTSFEQSGIETVIYAPPEPSLRHAGRFYKESVAIARQLKQAEADIVHFSDEKAAYHNSFAAFLAHARIVCHLRVSYPHLELRQRLCLLPVQSFIFVSTEAKQGFALSLPESKTRVIYDAIEIPDIEITESNISVREELKIPSNCFVVGMVARVSPQKDYFTLSAAAKTVLDRYPDVRFLIVGDNSDVPINREHFEEVNEKLVELGIAEKFIFTGHRSDVTRLIAAMNICVLSTHREGFPLSILEVMAMRRPVIATAVGGIPEIIEPGVTGYLNQHGDSKELAGIIISLIEDAATASRIGLAACEYVRQNHSREKFKSEISKAYLDAMRQ
jgi:glycosyltransferase involved in cell wall biosynthesis